MSQYINFKNVQVNPNIVLSIDEAGQTVDSIKRGQRIASIITTILTYVFILALALTVLFPFYWMIITSLKQKAEIEAALASAKLKQDLGLKKEHILYFLHRFANMDYTDVNCQKILIKTFVNSVFVYDDKVVLTFNYSGDDRTITLNEIDAGLKQGVRIPESAVHQTESTP